MNLSLDYESSQQQGRYSTTGTISLFAIAMRNRGTTKGSGDGHKGSLRPKSIRYHVILRYSFVLMVGILVVSQWFLFSSGFLKSKMETSIKIDHFSMVTSLPTTTHPTIINQTEILINNMPNGTHAPPNVIQLLDSSLPRFVRHRHTCISHIREAHIRLLGPHFQSDSKRTLFLDPAYHENIGDPMLVMGEFLFFAQFEQEVTECHCFQARKLVPDCNKDMFDKAQAKLFRVAAFHAGGKNYFGLFSRCHDGSTQALRDLVFFLGNWGDLWRSMMPHRFKTLKMAMQRNMRFVGMPQSLFYRKKTREASDTWFLKRAAVRGLAAQGYISYFDYVFAKISKATSTLLQNRVVLSWRENESLKKAQMMYPYFTNLLVPDMAFQLGPYSPIRTEKHAVHILILLRKDKESLNIKYRSREEVQKLLDIKGHHDTTFRIVDWASKNELFGNETLSVQNSIKLLSLGKVVLCDRLHSSILSYISGLPFAYMDQVSNKTSNTLGAAFDTWDGCHDHIASRYERARNFPEGLDKAIKMMKLG